MSCSSHVRFQQVYRCYLTEKELQEAGNRIILPESALDRLSSMLVEYPMAFTLSDFVEEERVTYCGVLEFTADEGTVLVPSTVMENMKLQEGGLVQITNVSVPKGTYVKLQPHTTAFADIANVKAVLESSLRNYACLTEGDTIVVAYNGRDYAINVLETRPSKSVSMVETDCEVDFVTALDYKPPAKAIASKQVHKPAKDLEEKEDEKAPFVAFRGTARRLDGEPVVAASAERMIKKQVKDEKKAHSKPHAKAVAPVLHESATASDRKEEKAMFVAFRGTARRLDGEPVVAASAERVVREQVKDEGRASTSTRMKFGTNNVKRDVKINGKSAVKGQPKQETAKPKFEPFTGKKSSF